MTKGEQTLPVNEKDLWRQMGDAAIRINGFMLPSFHYPHSVLPLYAHQINVLENWDKEDAILLLTKTGSGKTVAAYLPAIKRGESVFAVYPTNALSKDQKRSLKFILKRERISYKEITPENIDEKYGDETYHIIEVNADCLREYQKKFGVKSNGEALLRLIKLDKKKIVLINPDILFLILSLRYANSPDILAHLSGYDTIIIDEFHLYTDVLLGQTCFMLFLCKQMSLFKKFVFLSATPDEDVMAYLDKIFQPLKIRQSKESTYPLAKRKVIAFPVELRTVVYADSDDKLEKIASLVKKLWNEVGLLKKKHRQSNREGNYVPLVVVMNSVIEAQTLESMLMDDGVPQEEIASIRGLTSVEMRDVRNKSIVVGTAAIEVGVDFKMDYLIFEAGDVASFMQRFGRLGRHSRGTAYVLMELMQAMSLHAYPIKNGAMTRSQLENVVGKLYKYQNARAWFLNTFSGFVSIFSLIASFMKTLRSDRKGNPQDVEEIREWLNEMVKEYAGLIGAEKSYRQALAKIKLKRDWFLDFMETASFRNSLPNIEVWDTEERKRGRNPWHYEVELRMLLRRGNNFRQQDDGKFFIDGYNKKAIPVYVQKTFDQDEGICGTFLTTRNFNRGELALLAAGVKTPVSDILYRDKYHIFTVAPRAIIHFTDWKIGFFNCGREGRYIIAFDGDALLLREIYVRYFLKQNG